MASEVEFDGKLCRWEEEQLSLGDQLVWGTTPPEPGWCRAAVAADAPEHAAWFDVLGEDGAWLSVKQTTFACCPERWEVACFTWNLDAGRAGTLEEYDAELAARRWKWGQRRWARRGPDGAPPLQKDSFVVGKGHVSFCVLDGDELVLVPVR